MKPAQHLSKRQRIYRVVGVLAALLLSIYVAKGVLLYVFQRTLLFPAPSRTVEAPETYGLKNVQVAQVQTSDGLEHKAWFVAPKDGHPVILYFHGNGDDIAVSAGIMPGYLKRGYGFMLCEYRGYAGNPGKPDEQGIYADGRACVGWLKTHGYDTNSVVFYGESLGTGVAVQMATETPPKLLILESPYTSLLPVVQGIFSFYPVDLMLKDRLNSMDKIGKIKVPLLIIHGENDRLIPIAIGRTLFDAANEPKTFIEIKGGGHDNLYAFGMGPQIVDWLDKQTAGK